MHRWSIYLYILLSIYLIIYLTIYLCNYLSIEGDYVQAKKTATKSINIIDAYWHSRICSDKGCGIKSAPWGVQISLGMNLLIYLFV
jgi:hypothetical protein